VATEAKSRKAFAKKKQKARQAAPQAAQPSELVGAAFSEKPYPFWRPEFAPKKNLR